MGSPLAVIQHPGACFLSAGILSIGLAAAYYSGGECSACSCSFLSSSESGEREESPSSLIHQGLAFGSAGPSGSSRFMVAPPQGAVCSPSHPHPLQPALTYISGIFLCRK